ncbi:MAG: four helix bundle protein [Gemmatimonadales bacterium]
MQNYRRLAVWRKAHAIALNIHRLTEDIPQRRCASLVSQLQRAALSIPANIAEGASRGTEQEIVEVRRMLTGLVKHIRQANR